MRRAAEKELINWSNGVRRKPLIIRGARQVGKTHTVEKFGKKHFENCVTANFEKKRALADCFNTLEPQKIIAALSAMLNTHIVPGETLLFLDEIQMCPQAILALRYFKEELPALHVIAAGSLLEFTIKKSDFRMPVGRTQSLYLKPLSFKEFLMNVHQPELLKQIETATIEHPVDEIWHQLLLQKLTEYFAIGGMPEVLSAYLEHKDLNLCQQLQGTLLEDYPNDFGKYDTKINIRHLNDFYLKVPELVSEKFKYAKIDPNTLSRNLKPALQALLDADLIHQVKYSAASGLPLTANVNERKFKLFSLDIGLLKHATQLDLALLLDHDLLLLNQGSLAEQFVAQELLAYSNTYEKHKLFYWEREAKGSTAEIDFVINVGTNIIPVEVKAGKTGKLKSLQIFIDEKECDFGIRLSQHKLSFKNRVLSIPLYMISELPRLTLSITPPT
jgi:predicted AAA+ superfamily ATPase